MTEDDAMRRDVLDGMAAEPRSIPCKYFYDARGAELFEQICTLEAYYPTRTELTILHDSVADISRRLGPRCRVVELGSGSGTKVRILLDALEQPVAFTPVDISCEQLYDAAEQLARLYPDIEVQPVCADYTGPLVLPPAPGALRTVVFFPGSTIGNFSRDEATAFLRRASAFVGAGGALVIGVDRRKDAGILERAYNDGDGVTADFNLNLLTRLNRDVGTDFDVDAFTHRAVWSEAEGRVEMRLVSVRDQTISIPDGAGGAAVAAIREGEWIVTEHSHKYSPDEFAALADSAGWELERMYTDEDELFAVFLMRSADQG